MDRTARELMRIARELAALDPEDAAVDEVVDNFGDVKTIYTDFGAMELKAVRKKRTGDRWTFDCTLATPKGFYIPHWKGSGAIRDYGEDVAVKAFEKTLDLYDKAVISKIKKKLEQDPPIRRVVGFNEADDYDDVSAQVKSVRFGSKPVVDRGEIYVPGEFKVRLVATKLPDMSQGVYDQMSDRQLAQVVEAWGSYAPEWFWMDGEYRGTAAARIKGLMKDWRAITPHQQNKHYAELKQDRVI